MGFNIIDEAKVKVPVALSFEDLEVGDLFFYVMDAPKLNRIKILLTDNKYAYLTAGHIYSGRQELMSQDLCRASLDVSNVRRTSK